MGYNRYLIQRAFEVLPEGDKQFLLVKHHTEAIKMHIERILEHPHPRSQKLYNWVMSSKEIKKWYLENINSIKLSENTIIVNGCQYDLYDIYQTDTKKVQNYWFWSYKQAQHYLDTQQKEIPDWRELISFLPRENWDTFFTEVLGMEGKYLGDSLFHTLGSKNKISLSQRGASQWKLRGMKRL